MNLEYIEVDIIINRIYSIQRHSAAAASDGRQSSLIGVGDEEVSISEAVCCNDVNDSES